MPGIELILIPVTTVGKIVLTAASGIYVARYFHDPAKSLKGLTYLSVRILLPCMLFANLCLKVTWEALGVYYWAILLSMVPLILGYLFSLLFQRLLDREWHGVLFLGCTFQNGLIFPLSVVLSLNGIPWLTGRAFEVAQETMFLYNIICSAGLWAIGEPMIKHFKAQLDAEKAAAVQAHHHLGVGVDGEAVADADSPREKTVTPFSSPTTTTTAKTTAESTVGPTSAGTQKEDAVTQPAPVWREEAASQQQHTAAAAAAASPSHPAHEPPHSPAYMAYRPAFADPNPVSAGAQSSPDAPAGWTAVWHTLWDSAKSPPVAASLLALLISLVFPLRWIMDSYPGYILLGGMQLVGTGCIPLQLLVLGSTLSGGGSSKSNPPSSASPAASPPIDPAAFPHGSGEEDGVDVVVEAENTSNAIGGACWGAVARAYRRIPQVTLFTFLTCFLRLVIVPAATLVAVHLLFISGFLPRDKPFLLSLLIGISSPAAINSSLICSMYNYHAKEYARMIFIMYLSAILTATLWLMFSIWYVETNIPGDAG